MSQNQPTIAPQPGIMEISLYEGGASKVAGVENVVKLSSNENPFGPSEKAREAVIRAAHSLHRYPNTDHAGLRAAIGEVHGLDPDRIICGVGSDEIIHFLCQAYAGPGTEVLFTEHGFLMYRISAHAAGAVPRKDRMAARLASKRRQARGSGIGLSEVVALGHVDQFDQRGGVQFLQQAGLVGADGLIAQEHAVGDIFIGEALRQ